MFFSTVRTVGSRQKRGLNRRVESLKVSEVSARVDSYSVRCRQIKCLKSWHPHSRWDDFCALLMHMLGVEKGYCFHNFLV